MPRARHDSIVAVRPALQWWFALAVIAGVYVICCLIIPPLISSDLSMSTFGTWLMEAASLLGVSCAAIGALAFCCSLDVRRLRETQRDRLDPDPGMVGFRGVVSAGFHRLGSPVGRWPGPGSRGHVILQEHGEKTRVE